MVEERKEEGVVKTQAKAEERSEEGMRRGLRAVI